MMNEIQVDKNPGNNLVGVLAGVLIGGLAGAVTMLLLAPRSGKETRTQLQKKGIELRDRTSEMVDDVMMQVRTKADEMEVSGREKIKELTQQGQTIVVKSLEHVSEAAQSGKKAIESFQGLKAI